MIIENAYAKINLVLNVVNKREDGYHEVDFLMNSVNLHDKIFLEKADKDDVICPRAPFINKETNLAYLAYKLMKEKFSLPDNIRISIHKLIPVSAGMAGGSSDAAAVIRGLNRMYNLELTEAQMAEIGAELGSDVPFCIYSRLARATGRGEKIELINQKLPKAYITVVNPGVALSTPVVYKNHVIENTNKEINAILNASTFEQFVDNLHNDLEVTAKKIEPKIEQMIDYIRQKFDNKILVSGSGPTILIFSETEADAENVYQYAVKKYRNTYYTETRD